MACDLSDDFIGVINADSSVSRGHDVRIIYLTVLLQEIFLDDARCDLAVPACRKHVINRLLALFKHAHLGCGRPYIYPYIFLSHIYASYCRLCC